MSIVQRGPGYPVVTEQHIQYTHRGVQLALAMRDFDGIVALIVCERTPEHWRASLLIDNVAQYVGRDGAFVADAARELNAWLARRFPAQGGTVDPVEALYGLLRTLRWSPQGDGTLRVDP